MTPMNLPFTPRLPPLPYQAAYLRDHGLDPAWGMLWDPGTGKSKSLIDNAALLLCHGLIDGMLVLAPNGPHRGWVVGTEAEPAELEKHWPLDAPAPYEAFVWETAKTGNRGYQADWKRFLSRVRSPLNPGGPFGVLTMSYSGIMTDAGKQASWDFIRARPVLYAADESQYFKEMTSKRNIRVFASSAYAPYKRIASGTPMDKPFDIYPQMRFLDEDFWKKTLGVASVAAFRAHFGNYYKMRLNTGVTFDKLNDRNPYQRLDELDAVLNTRTTRLTEEEAELNLPPRVYRRVYHDLTAEQRTAWEELKEECMTTLAAGQLVTAEHVLTLRLRLMQIGCGFVTPTAGANPVPFGVNPRRAAMKGVLGSLDQREPALCWGLFTQDLRTLRAASLELGRRPVVFSADDTAGTVDAWKAGHYDDLIGQLGSGLTEFYTLNRAAHTLYYSNTPRLIARQQSEKRNHRIGQAREVMVYDFLARGTNDEANLEAVRVKARWAGQAMGDDPARAAAWLRASLTADPTQFPAPAEAPLGAVDWMDPAAYEAALGGLT